MSDFGSRLKQAREARGVALRDIATQTKISIGLLEALERGDVGRLPGGIFSRSFVRAYATEVGLDPDATVQEFLEEVARSEHEAASLSSSAEVTADDREFLERQRKAARWLRIVLIALVVGIVALLAWELRIHRPH